MQERKSNFENQPLSEILQKVSPEKAEVFVQQLNKLLEEQVSKRGKGGLSVMCRNETRKKKEDDRIERMRGQQKKKKQLRTYTDTYNIAHIYDGESRIDKLTAESARRQFFKAIYDRDYALVKLLLTGSRRKYVHANLVCPDDRWTALHACLYKYNQYPPDDTLRIVELLLDHNADVSQACPEGAVAINVLDKKPLANGLQNGPENPNREKKTVSFQNKMVLDVAIDFLQAYKWAGCRPSVLQNWKPLIELLDKWSISQKNKIHNDFETNFTIPRPKIQEVDGGYCARFQRVL
ncbi:hypothetical protein RFI_25104 [Reticulomyxa filosa]|uniref:Ankyrin repeat protein n=1 Tax=Reticulomyxa filosa TaxID=46433 RepID=X6ME34_RETFI|nr:hypothetical protein RFI_25104 [Reticulomyxa filosa]|eukprot:ETO12273.1 hypothetical protein RFI_25104 [Reticulomyxa filosa]